jgi:hypothetical protein
MASIPAKQKGAGIRISIASGYNDDRLQWSTSRLVAADHDEQEPPLSWMMSLPRKNVPPVDSTVGQVICPTRCHRRHKTN